MVYIQKFRETILKIADCVICSSDEQLQFLRTNFRIHPIVVLIDYFECDFPTLFNDHKLRDERQLGSRIFWEGQAENLTNFKVINDAEFFRCSITLVTDSQFKKHGLSRRTAKLCDDMFQDFRLVIE